MLFRSNWRDLGGKVFVDRRVLLKHTGTYVFDYQTQDKLYQDLHEIATNNQIAAAAAQTQATPVEAKVIATNKKPAKKDKAAKAA